MDGHTCVCMCAHLYENWLEFEATVLFFSFLNCETYMYRRVFKTLCMNLSLFSDDTGLYVENSRDFTKKLLELIKESVKL